MRFRTFSFLFAVFFNILLSAQEVFAYAQTETQLAPVGSSLDEAAASGLTWAVCGEIVTRVTMAARTRTRDAYQWQTAESMPLGTYCLLVDSASHDRMIVWGWPEPSDAEFGCVKGFSEAAEALARRKVDSCYFIGGHGAGSVEVVLYKNQSPTDRLAALSSKTFVTHWIITTGWRNFQRATRFGWARTTGIFIQRNSITCSPSSMPPRMRTAMGLR